MTATIPYDTMSVSSISEPIFRKCCFCFPIRIGCLILGYFNLIFNAFHTMSLLAFMADFGITTHGFDHLDYERSKFDGDFPKPPLIFEKSLLSHIEVFLIVSLCANIVWLLINISCLVGLHKKRPGPIKVYVGFASARLLLSFSGFLYLAITATAYSYSFVIYSVDLSLSTYFILVYYIYALQLERELNETETKQDKSLPRIEKVPLPDSGEKGNGIAYIYPIDVDKVHLVV